jgi:DNA repair protein RadC
MRISDWPANERPREKLLQKGAEALSDAELVAIFLRTGTRGQTAVDLARTLLDEYGGLRALLAASRHQFCRGRGLGTAKYALLQAVLEMSRRCLYESARRGDPLSGPNDARDYLHALLHTHPSEVFACLFLDTRHRIIACEELFRGTIDGASVHPREIVRYCMRHNAAAVILAHNHPSGVAEPSQADTRITQKIREALAMIDVRVLDHIVVGDASTVSLAERGLI